MSQTFYVEHPPLPNHAFTIERVGPTSHRPFAVRCQRDGRVWSWRQTIRDAEKYIERLRAGVEKVWTTNKWR